MCMVLRARALTQSSILIGFFLSQSIYTALTVSRDFSIHNTISLKVMKC